MRKLSLIILALCTASVPMTAEAGPAKTKDKPGNSGQSSKNEKTPPGHAKSPPKGPAVVATIVGAGQRLHFSFGGDLTLRKNNRLVGEFAIIAHLQAPTGNAMVVSCQYREFSNPKLNDNHVSFVGKGRCSQLSTTGKITHFDVTNEIYMIDNGADKDVISVKMIGPTGIGIPTGHLSFGNFSVRRVSSNTPGT